MTIAILLLLLWLFSVAEGPHYVFVNNFWEAEQTGNRSSLQYYYYETSRCYTKVLYAVIDSDTTITAHFSKKWCPGDVDGSGLVDIVDIVTVAIYFGANRSLGDPYPFVNGEWNSITDLNCDGVINIVDIAIVQLYFDRTY